ncbi:CaiB/BaiF CoA transferase family protein [Variovorax sp. RCC_210]|uniref:CaiB/BaiF CoA transferase family protein n=1 Tax=Variovorax sp. RCC_210 TaxID=3239217 RepID=UPI0035232DEF
MATVAAGTPGALTGIRVLDFTFVMSGPYCTRLMADLGAEVIKIESKHGDLTRSRPPFRDGRSSYYASLNCGKRSIVLDLKSPEARDIVHDMVKQADVVVENFRPGVMKRLGLGYEALSEINPRLVYCSISGFGQGKSGDGKGAYAPTLHALSGFDDAMRGYQDDASRPPNTGIFVADVLGGSLAFGGIQAALVQRQRTGRGDLVDLSLLDSMVSLLVCEVGEAQFPEQPLHFVYKPTPARDGHLVVAPTTQDNFVALCKATGHPEWLEDERFATGRGRQVHWDAFLAELAKWALQHTAEECERILDAHQVPCSRYLNIGETMQLPVVKERGTMCEIDDGAGPFLVAGTPFRMANGNAGPRAHVPVLGADGPAILGELLGKDAAGIARLREAGVLGG